MPCALCGSWHHNRSACPLDGALAQRELADLINLQDELDAEAPAPGSTTEDPPCP